MTVEEITGSVVCNNEIDRFPIGMRVLAVDDDPTCLKVLEGLLKKCQYQVTTTNQAITALKMIRENRSRFDLIISDVYMPDMDGFKLLELIGLEMDLPVIMLSGCSDRKLVMKGITHGACDYLVKPVRLEELRNVCQHVIRRKVETNPQSKSNSKSKSNNNENDDEVQNVNVNMNRKRKDEEDDDEDEDSDDLSSTQKKPRVKWSGDLHRKFVDAINQLGIEKAVPKKILELMNVDGLTRENVASHLQKFRRGLKKISQKANLGVASRGSKDKSAYMRTSPLDGLGDFRALSSSERYPSGAYAPTAGLLGRLNAATGVTLHSLTAPPLETNHTHNQLLPFVPSVAPNHQNINLFQGIQPSIDLDHQQYGKTPNTQLTEYGPVEKSRTFTGTKLADFSSINETRMFTGTQLPIDESFNYSASVSGGFGYNTTSSQLPIDESFNYSASVTGGFGNNTTNTVAVPVESHSSGDLGGDIVPNVSQSLPNHNSEIHTYTKQDYIPFSQNGFSNLASTTLANGGGGLSGPLSHTTSHDIVHTERTNTWLSEDYLVDHTKIQGGFASSNGYGSLDDLIMMKKVQEPPTTMAEEFGYVPYGFGSCI